MVQTPSDVVARERLGPLSSAVEVAATDLVARDALHRLWTSDHTLWQDDPREAADRLGWLAVADQMADQVDDLEAFAAAAAADGLRHAVLLGMGGSSLFPEVLWRTFGARPGCLDLRVLDTTDPAAIARVAADLDLDACLFVAASKSGTTIETSSQLAHFWGLTGGDGRRFVAITDSHTELARLGRQRNFRRVFENRGDIGGRYSALSYFGLVPAALLGVDLTALLAGVAPAVGPTTGAEHPGGEHPALRLGAIIGAAALQGRDKLTLVLPHEIGTFGLWLEQLVAESTGKDGTGIVPVTGEHLGRDKDYGDDRLFVSVGYRPGLDDLAAAGQPVVELAYQNRLDLGGLVMVWEQAVALAGAVLGVNPFDQPDVAAAKAATAKVLEAGLPGIEPVPLTGLLDQIGPGDYLALQAYVDPGDDELLRGIHDARMVLRDRLKVATTLGIGPRYLHSTGQLHKGGPPSGVFVQVVGEDTDDVAIPGAGYGFSTLKQAQAAGDLLSLQERGLRAGRVKLSELLEVTA
ncbi:MAG: glucose-6-phosphate isomerase [Actinomycetota bacterium]|nr:glucose-6-phosphate isomerase [Actinomycetota bacterium]